MSQRNPTKDDDEFLEKARERFREAKEYWDTIYNLAREDTEFYAGDQWPKGIKAQREADLSNPRPCLTINRLPQFHNQIVNAYRQSGMSMQAAPQETEDEEVARIYKGLFRQIEKQSHAQVAYVKALSDGCIGGVGYIRALSQYADSKSFNQDLYIKRVTNPFSHYPDPYATEFFLEDAEYWFVIDKIKKKAYEKGGEYADFEPDDFTGEESYRSDWRGDDSVIIAEYFYFETERKTLILFKDGSTAFEEDIKDEDKAEAEEHTDKKRKVDVRTLKWCKIDGYNILEKATEWGAPRIPIVPVWGNELWIAEKRQLTGLVRNSKDSQRMYNYWQSSKTEMIALAPKAPYIAAEGQLEGAREDEWRNATITPKSVLYYKPVSVDGHLVGAPQRQTYEAPVQGIIQASLQSSDDMKATIGIYDASLGQAGNEVSGRAITARKSQGMTATYNFIDNLALAIGYIGVIIAELIPVYYDTERQLRIVGEDGKISMVKVNGPGQKNIVDVKYDLVLNAGANYATQREETVSILTELARQYPKVWDIAGDIAVRNMDFAGAREIAERLKRTLPPQVIADDDDPETKLIAANTAIEQMKSALAAATDKIGELTTSSQMMEAQLKDKTGELRIKQQEVNIKRDEAKAKLITAAAAAQDGKNANALMAEAMEAIQELGGRMDGVMDMVQALSDEPVIEAANDDVSSEEGVI